MNAISSETGLLSAWPEVAWWRTGCLGTLSGSSPVSFPVALASFPTVSLFLSLFDFGEQRSLKGVLIPLLECEHRDLVPLDFF